MYPMKKTTLSEPAKRMILEEYRGGNANKQEIAKKLQSHFPVLAKKTLNAVRFQVSTEIKNMESTDDVTTETSWVTQKEQTKNTLTLTSPKGRVLTIDQLIEKTQVDLDEREVDRSVVNKRDNVMRDDEGNAVVTELYQIKARLKKRAWLSKKQMQDIVKDSLKKYKVTIPTYEYKPKKDCLAEVNIFDAHFGKLAREDETGESYDIKIAQEMYISALDDLLYEVSLQSPEIIVLTLWQDFFNSDNVHGGTTKGTPQDNDGRHQKAFKMGLSVARTAVECCASIAPKVVIKIVVWNHDEMSSYHLWEVLEAIYEDAENIEIDNTPPHLKVYEYGKCLISRDHEWPKNANIPWIVARDYPEARGRTRHREHHRGHLHREDAMDFNGFKVRTDPSISGKDARHASKGYGSLRGAKAYIWHKEAGLKYQIHHNV